MSSLVFDNKKNTGTSLKILVPVPIPVKIKKMLVPGPLCRPLIETPTAIPKKNSVKTIVSILKRKRQHRKQKKITNRFSKSQLDKQNSC